MSEMTDDNICPRCGAECYRDEVHNGVALLTGPWGCVCGWSEDERYDQTVIDQPPEGHIDQWGGFTPRADDREWWNQFKAQ